MKSFKLHYIFIVFLNFCVFERERKRERQKLDKYNVSEMSN